MGKQVLLPALASLLASGLHLDPLSELTATTVARSWKPRRGAGKAARSQQPPSRSALLIVAGLTRHFSVSWPAIEQSLLLPNEAMGYNFTIVFSTDLSLDCHPGSKQWRHRKCEEPSNESSTRQRIREVLAPRRVKVVDPGNVCEKAWKFGPDGIIFICAPWFERVRRVIADEVLPSGEEFDKVVALRPDMVINWAQPGEGTPKLLLDPMCATKPGLQFVTPSWKLIHKASLHNRDLDFMQILCPGHQLPDYEESLQDPIARCILKKRERPPNLPEGFNSTKGWYDKSEKCHFVQVLNNANISLSHWDDNYTCDWPTLENDTSDNTSAGPAVEPVNQQPPEDSGQQNPPASPGPPQAGRPHRHRHRHQQDPAPPEPASTRSVLLAVAGLTRHFSVSWPAIEQSLLLPNEAMGYNFTIVFSTDLSLDCHPGSKRWTHRKCEQKSDALATRQHIREVMAPRRVKVVDPGNVCEKAGSYGQDGLIFVCAPWFERVRRLLADEILTTGETFDRVVALRPDMVINWAQQGLGTFDRTGLRTPKLLLDPMCDKKPGLSFVTPSWTLVHRSSLHNRDLDFMQVLCPGHQLPAYERALQDPLGRCILRKGDKGPALPPEFKSTRGWHEGSEKCRFVQVLNASGISISHWDDDFMCDWPNLDEPVMGRTAEP